MSDKNKNHKVQNPPNYMIKVDKRIEEIIREKKKFSFHIIKEDLVSLMIDNENQPHLLNDIQFHAFTLAVLRISEKVNPEIDYSKLFKSTLKEN